MIEHATEVSNSCDREVTSVSVYNDDKQRKVIVELQGLKKKDFYATNLHLTGSTNWFGSGNMCDLLNDNSNLLFGNSTSEVATTLTTSALTYLPRRKLSFLELGSGPGRAGIMAAKLMSMYDSFDCCVLTDGK